MYRGRLVDDAPVRRLRHAPRRPTSASSSCSAPARPACRAPSTCPPRWATTPTTPAPRARSARSAWPSTRSRTCSCCSHGLPLDKVTTSMTINSTAAILLLLYELVAEEQGVPATAIGGTIQNDLLKEYIARGTYIYPPRPSMRIITDIFAYCRERRPAVEHDLDLRLPHPRGRLAPRCRRSRSRSPTASPTCRRRSTPVSTSTSSRPACRSSGTATTTSSRRSPSSAPRGACGTGS